MDLEVPENFFKAPSDATEDDKKYHAVDKKTIAKQRIMAAIVGDDSMGSVVALYDAKTLAEGKLRNIPITGKRNFTKSLRPLCEFFATDDFAHTTVDVHDEIIHLTGGAVVDYDELAIASTSA
eukprot:scaffold38223_cov153-Amphora_coffeaeformis.AAC.2